MKSVISSFKKFGYIAVPIAALATIFSVLLGLQDNSQDNSQENHITINQEVKIETEPDKGKTNQTPLKPDSDKSDIKNAQDLFDQGQIMDAIKIFERIALKENQIGKDSNLKEALALRYIGYIACSYDKHKALKAFKRSTELDPNNKDGWIQLGHLYQRMDKLSEAEKTYKTLILMIEIEADPDPEVAVIAYDNLANIYQTKEEPQKAGRFYELALGFYRVLDNHKGMANVYKNLGKVSQTQGDLDKSTKFYRNACSGLMEADTLMRDNIIVTNRGVYERETSLQAIYTIV